ncbi:glycosyltransferase family 4 protein [Sphingobacterium pedocola]|uniref:Glycosyl transferase family 1 domain-containing protein n=1 Tax=Sphingobacterium pedocola TaxID=2082722 RepID=A0ABR9T1W5_9SPHI|nr:glycosyltransferase family 1 protein [Sphingobacterium pedocola]MBE8719328.1 hypothetical protein [Sphingobacterium pedocola]
MKVCYIFREKERNAHSIENLFDAISTAGAKKGIQVEKWYKPLSKLKAIFSVRKLNADVYHITGDCYYLALFLPWRKTIMTIHDIGMYKNHSKTPKRRLFAFLSFVLPLRVLTVSTVISDLTKNDLVKLLNADERKLKVIPNPLVLPVRYRETPFNSVKPTILQIGTGDHKNLIGLIEAAKGLNCHLDIIGRPSEMLKERMKSYQVDYTISVNLTQEEMIDKYYKCDILYFASLSEGFGLPILEAQATGKPVVTSNTEPTKTVCGGGAVLVDPNDHDSIRDALIKIQTDHKFRNKLVQNGLDNILKYDLENITDQYISLYYEYFLYKGDNK